MKRKNNVFKYFIGIITCAFVVCNLQFSAVPMHIVSHGAIITEGRAECVMELNSRRILYEKQGDLRLPMASTTKIATAITVLNTRQDVHAEVTIPPEAVGIEGSSVYLKAGDVYSVEDLLYGLMLRSGNDCATALALYTSGSIRDFAVEMNQTAQKAGALQTNFKNPHGLPCNGHYTTARDLSLISCYAMQNAMFRKIVSTKYYEPRHWKNKNKMLEVYEGGIGVKTGYTKEAGRCLVSAAERGEMSLVCTVLNCSNTYERSMALFDDAFSMYSYEKLLENNEKIEVAQGERREIGYTREEFFYPLMEGEKELVERRIIPIFQKEIIGQIQIWLAKRLLFSTNLYKL